MDNILNNSRFGWIGLYRSMISHWIYPNESFTKFEAWIDLLLMVNHSEQKVFNGSDIEICKVGEKITSQQKLMSRWGWSKSKLIKFLKVLKNDGMIDYKSYTKKTVINIVNFQLYQDFGGIDKLKKDHKKTVEKLKTDYKKTIEELTKRLQKDTNNNVNTEKEEKNVNDSFEIKYLFFLDNFNLLTKRKFKGDDKTKRQFKGRLSNGYTWNDFEKAIKNLYNDPYHKENNFKYATPEFITRPEKLEMYLNSEISTQNEKRYPGKIGKRDYYEPDLLKITKEKVGSNKK